MRIKHHIIVRFADGTDVKALTEPVTRLFEETLAMPGIHGVEVKASNSDRAGRYDLMIVMDMDKDALAAYDASEHHLRWKTKYGGRIAEKAIFDCDD